MIGSNRRRRTISKPSSAVAGRHDEFDASDHVAQPVERLASANAADLDVVGLGVRRTARVGSGQRDNEQAVLGELGQFGQHLGEGELRLEPAGRQVALIVELPGIGDRGGRGLENSKEKRHGQHRFL